LRPYAAGAGTLEVRGAFFTLFTGQLKILGVDDGLGLTRYTTSSFRMQSSTFVGLSLKPLKLSPEYLEDVISWEMLNLSKKGDECKALPGGVFRDSSYPYVKNVANYAK